MKACAQIDLEFMTVGVAHLISPLLLETAHIGHNGHSGKSDCRRDQVELSTSGRAVRRQLSTSAWLISRSENPAGGLYSYRNDRGLREMRTVALAFRPTVFTNYCGRPAFMNSWMRFAKYGRSFR